jgi:hypothetical protein
MEPVRLTRRTGPRLRDRTAIRECVPNAYLAPDRSNSRPGYQVPKGDPVVGWLKEVLQAFS